MLDIYFKNEQQQKRVGVCEGTYKQYANTFPLLIEYLRTVENMPPDPETGEVVGYFRAITQEKSKEVLIDYGSHFKFFVVKEVEDDRTQ